MKISWNFVRPLWIDSLYGSNNSNLPSIYDDSYAPIHRSNATTTNAYHPSTLVPSPQKSTDQIDEITKYSLTDIVLQGPSLQDTCVSDSKLSEKHEQKQLINNSIRRIQSDVNVKLNITQTSSINENRLIKKSKSMIEIRFNNNEETKTIVETNEPKTYVEVSSTVDVPIDDWRPILQILENVFADDDETSDMITAQPESLEPLLPNKKSYSNDHRYPSKLMEQQNDQQDESTIPTRFRRTHSNQGRRRRRTPRRATCK